MNLWTVIWPASNYPEERESWLVWAWGSDEARALAWITREWQPDGRPLEPDDCDAREMHVTLHHTAHEPLKCGVHRETRREVMRDCGWWEEGDDYACESCGRYSMGLAPVCPDCYLCSECGCECEEHCGCECSSEEG